jgi:site-specific DNA-methyltransferase (adenine-specific)
VPFPTCRHCGKEIKDYGGYREKLNPAGLNLSDFWDDTSPNRHAKHKVRPGVNELKLVIPERALLIATSEDDVVLDPFGGGGTTFEAAEAHNRYWIGSELYDSDYIRIRLSQKFPESIGKDPQLDCGRIFFQKKRVHRGSPYLVA